MKESEWIQAMLKGNEQASEWFVREHYPRIYRWLCRLCGDAEVAQDLTQQTFLKAWQAMATFRSHALIRTWLHRIAYHEYVHWLRDRKPHESLDLAQEVPAPETYDRESNLDLQSALLKLPPDLRATFLLYYVQELKVSEVAEIMNLPEGTVKSRLFVARQRLREILVSGDSMPPLLDDPDLLPELPSIEVKNDEKPTSAQQIQIH